MKNIKYILTMGIGLLTLEGCKCVRDAFYYEPRNEQEKMMMERMINDIRSGDDYRWRDFQR